MNTNSEVTVDWLAQLANGEDKAVAEFWHRYGDALQRVAERQIATWLRRRVDPEDVVQSACRTFFRRAAAGNFSLESKDDLWRLLLTITLNKVRMQARYHTRDRRAVNKEQALPDSPALQPAEWDSAIENIDLQDMLEAAFTADDGERQRVLQLWLEQYTQAEIAAKIGCSERTVRRIQEKIRRDLAGHLNN
ncbi:MAG: sigma-70 family RNA polymerase sigma factor [Planctomycetales bacterium]|nr:sigma-70 family RNA polymerase sigma factor [Planctomycetales bacterium]